MASNTTTNSNITIHNRTTTSLIITITRHHLITVTNNHITLATNPIISNSMDMGILIMVTVSIHNTITVAILAKAADMVMEVAITKYNLLIYITS